VTTTRISTGALAGGIIGTFFGGLIFSAVIFWAFPQLQLSRIQSNENVVFLDSLENLNTKGTLRETLGGRLGHDPPAQTTTVEE